MLAPTRPLVAASIAHRRHSSTAAAAPLLRIAQCRHRRPAPPHHAATAPRCATCCRKRVPHHARFTRCSQLHLVPSQCRCKPCSALLAAAFFAHPQSFREPCVHNSRRRRHRGTQHRAQARYYFRWLSKVNIWLHHHEGDPWAIVGSGRSVGTEEGGAPPKKGSVDAPFPLCPTLFTDNV
jgi:hypothetical protein